MGVEQFSYDNFAAMFKGDNRLKSLIKNFDGKNIRFNQGGMNLGGTSGEKDAVGQMAKNAVDLSDL
jgi:hypothetical protein